MSGVRQDLRPGQRVRVRQVIQRREGDWHHEVCGVILDVRDEPTGSWFAHGKNQKLWLRRIRLQKDDGDITTIAIDQRTEVEPAPTGLDAGAEEPAVGVNRQSG